MWDEAVELYKLWREARALGAKYRVPASKIVANVRRPLAHIEAVMADPDLRAMSNALAEWVEARE